MTKDYRSQKDIIKKVKQEGQTVVLELQGDIDMGNSPVVRTKIIELFQDKPQVLVINMTEVGYMDSSGLGTLVEALKWSNRKGAQLRLVGVTGSVRNVFEISRLVSIFNFFSNEEEALSQ